MRQGKSISLKNLESDRRKLKNFFNKLGDYFYGLLISNYKSTLTDLTKYLIALELMHEFGGKAEKIDDKLYINIYRLQEVMKLIM